MENKVKNINIEKNKELFEYEMTEVILKLKGEFAVFSGKDTKFAEMVVDDAKLRINTPEVVHVKVEDYCVETPVIGRVQQTKTVCIEAKETVLQLPVIPQISDERGKKEESAYSPRKANVWQGIVVPTLPLISKVMIAKGSPEKLLEEVKKTLFSSVEVPQINHAGGCEQVLPTITCEAVQIDVPSMAPFKITELKKAVVAINREQIDFQETHRFKYEIKKPTVTREVVTVPELKHIQAYKFDDVCMKHQPILVPDAPKCNNMRKSVGIKNAKLGVMLPKTEIPHVREINIMTVSVPTVSLQGHKTILLKKVAKRNIDIPSTTQPTFSDLTMVEHKQFAGKIEIHPVKVNGDLDEVAISYHGVIAIPQKPEVKETVDNIIALAVAKR